jgi:hypothetical protein
MVNMCYDDSGWPKTKRFDGKVKQESPRISIRAYSA